jgi:hypothetical protein
MLDQTPNTASDTTTQTAAESTTSTQATTTQTDGTATTGADKTSATATQQTTEEQFPKSVVERMIKDRLKGVQGYKEAYEAMVEAGVVDKNQFASPADVVAFIRQQATRAQTQQTQGAQPDPRIAVESAATKAARSEGMDVRIEIAAEDLAKDPLYSDILDHMDDLKPMARLLGGGKDAVKKAYLAIAGDAALDRHAKAVEARTIANLEAKRNKGVETGDAGGEAAALGVTADEMRFYAEVFGINDPKRIKALKEADDLSAYQRTKKK